MTLHQPSPSTSTRRSRRAFTIIELLVVVAIIALLASMVLVVYGRVGENARIASTKTLLKQLDSTLQDRMESFRRYNFAPLAQSFFRYSGTQQAYEPVAWFRKLTYRTEFPQRFEDLYGYDGESGDGHTIDGSPPMLGAAGKADNSPLWGLIRKRVDPMYNSIDMADANSPAYISNGELLFLFLTEASSYGLPALDLSQVSPRHIVDSDDDSFPEFVDGWGNPLGFYNAPTGLLRPGGNVYDKDSGMGQPITVANYNNARILIRSLPQLPLDSMTGQPRNLAYDEFDHPLNIDPQDYLGIITIDADMTTDNEDRFEQRWHAMDTFYVPLLVSAGPDGLYGLFRPNERELTVPPPNNNRDRLCVINNLDDVYDNLTNYQRGGF
ncbi:MAG: type II secretion system protein [Planctomycetaceae bacterium]|nr:type II secretion system protein [Planctomycetaceae bacterium]